MMVQNERIHDGQIVWPVVEVEPVAKAGKFRTGAKYVVKYHWYDSSSDTTRYHGSYRGFYWGCLKHLESRGILVQGWPEND